MRLILSICFLIIFKLSVFSQSTAEADSKTFYGFTMGLNYTNIQALNNPFEVGVQNNAGFTMGVLGGHQLTKNFALVANSAVSFHNNNLYAANGNPILFAQILLPVTLDFGIHAKFNLSNSDKSPYLSIGSTTQIPTSSPVLSAEFGSRTNIALEMGMGCDIKFSEFIFAPEIRYSYGLNNVNTNPNIWDTKFHTIKVLFNFRSL